MNTRLLLSIACMVVALLMWGAIGWQVWSVVNAPAPVTQAVSDSNALKLLSFVKSTESARTSLKSLTAVDIVAAARSVEDAGKKVGLPVHIGGSTASGQGSGKNLPPLESAYLAIDAQGTFGQITQLIGLLESLPNPSALDQFQIATIADGAKSTWRFSGRVKVLFTSSDSL